MSLDNGFESILSRMSVAMPTVVEDESRERVWGITVNVPIIVQGITVDLPVKNKADQARTTNSSFQEP